MPTRPCATNEGEWERHVRLRHLALAHFRRFASLDHDVAPGTTVIWGDNGAGKSNLVEASYLLATTRSPYTASERDLISWDCPYRPAFARVIGDCVGAAHGTVEVRVVEPDGSDSPTEGVPPHPYHPTTVRRRAILDGRARPIGDVLGNVIAVHFSPEAVELVAGPSEGRRRFLDVALAQVDPGYLRALRRFQRAITQRNALLRRLREDRSLRSALLDPWESEAATHGAIVVACRVRAVARLNDALGTLDAVAPGASSIRVTYRPSIDLRGVGAPPGPYRRGIDDDGLVAAIRAALEGALAAARRRDLGSVTTSVGPHRDDFVVQAGEIDQRTYGSRGQQRTAALAIKVAESRLMHEVMGAPPILLLDDVMSELDPRRRAFVETLALAADQAIITGTERAVFSDRLLGAAARFHLHDGRLAPS